MSDKYKILVVDDDQPVHIFTDKALGENYHLSHADNAQEAIDLVSKESFNLILTDIHMPGMTGLEFLESLLADANKKDIPVLIMTSLPTVEKEKKALDLGAADFVDKSIFFQKEKDELLNRVQMKLVANVNVPELPEGLKVNKKHLVSVLMDEVLTGDFFTASRKLFMELRKVFELDHIYLWSLRSEEPQVLLSIGNEALLKFGPAELKQEKRFSEFLKDKKPYLSNHVFHGEGGIFCEASKKENLPAEAGIPLYAMTDRELVKNKMKIMPGTEVFAFVTLKRNRLITTEEFNYLTRFLVQCGTILWRLFNKL